MFSHSLKALETVGRCKEKRANKRSKWNTKCTAYKSHLLQRILCVRLQNENAAIKKKRRRVNKVQHVVFCRWIFLCVPFLFFVIW